MVLAPPPAVVGYLNYPSTTHIDEWVTNNQVISTSRTPSAPATIGALAGYTIVESGVLAGAQPLTVAGPATSLGPFNGGGKVITTANNTLYGMTTVQNGAIYQVGLDTAATTGSVNSTTVQSGGLLNLYGANTALFTKVGPLTTDVGGTASWDGPDICGQGYFTNGGAVTNNGVINIDNSMWRLSTSIAGTGTVNVKDGGTFGNAGLNVPTQQNFNLNGCGWCNSAGVRQGALFFEGVGYWYATTTIETASCIKSAPGAGVYFQGLLKGSAPLEAGNTGSPVTGIVVFQNPANTYDGTLTSNGSLVAISSTAMKYATLTAINGGQITSNSGTFKSIYGSDATSYLTGSGNTYIENNGVTQFDGRFLWDGQSSGHNIYLQGGSGNQLTLTAKGSAATLYVQGGSKLTLQGASTTGQVRVLNGSVVSAGTSTDAATGYLLIDATSSLEVRAVGSGSSVINIVGAGGVNVAAGWKVDLPDAMAPGVYTIIKNSGGAAVILPTTGVNNTGLTATYAWDNTVAPKVLKMTLA
jgi:hypothetical protein